MRRPASRVAPVRDVPFARLVEHDAQAGVVVAPERDPGLRSRHHPRAGLRLLAGLERPDDEAGRLSHRRGP